MEHVKNTTHESESSDNMSRTNFKSRTRKYNTSFAKSKMLISSIVILVIGQS
jgi:hypothetical protein